MRILITGGAGFIGSNLAKGFKIKYPSYEVVALDNLKRRGSDFNLNGLIGADVKFRHGDIRNAEDLEDLDGFDLVIDASAEPSVLAGINSSARQVINNNLVATTNVLELVRQNKAKFIFLSTSRVYPVKALNEIAYSEGENRFELSHVQKLSGISEMGIREDFPLEGSRSFYGTTKLASEILIEEYQEYCGVKAVTNRCGVVSGPGQMGKVDQGVVVLWMARHFWKQELSYIGFGGTGKQVRDILHVADLFDLIDYQCHHFEEVSGQKFNIGGGKERSSSLLELTASCAEITGNTIPIHQIKETRKADVRIYITDNRKVNSSINWIPKRSTQQLLEDVFEWFKKNELILKPILG